MLRLDLVTEPIFSSKPISGSNGANWQRFLQQWEKRLNHLGSGHAGCLHSNIHGPLHLMLMCS